MTDYIPLGQYKLQVTAKPGELSDGTEVYIKEIRLPEDIHPCDREKELQRIKSQVRIGSSLEHPHHITLLAYSSKGDTHRLTYSCAAGIRLDDILQERNLQTEEVLLITEQIAAALAYCHDDFTPPVIHGDLSPGNVFLFQKGICRNFQGGVSNTEEIRKFLNSREMENNLKKLFLYTIFLCWIHQSTKMFKHW
ncbi:MAG: protein kinase [Nanoarchaeota archaeon]